MTLEEIDKKIEETLALETLYKNAKQTGEAEWYHIMRIQLWHMRRMMEPQMRMQGPHEG